METEEVLHIRSNSWGAATISWSVVIEELLYAAEQMGHRSVFVSTNGYNGMKYWSDERAFRDEVYARQFLRSGNNFDIDLTYTVPQNFSTRFSQASKCRMAIYAYESSIMPQSWRQYYSLVDYVLPPSTYCADMIRKNGCPEEKIKIVPHGVDTNIFHPNATPLEIQTDKSFKFLCVAEPHYRKQIDKLLELYCKTFTANDDVCLVLKTKLFRTSQELASKAGFEMDLRPVITSLKKKYGPKIPEIKFITSRIPNMASLYTACDAFVLMTASEGWGVPYLEALACGIPVIAPRHGGQLQFLNDNNSILTKCDKRRARPQEIYWGGDPNGIVGSPDENEYAQAMSKLWRSRTMVLKGRSQGISSMVKEDMDNKFEKMRKAGLETASNLTWKNAMSQIITLSRGGL